MLFNWADGGEHLDARRVASATSFLATLQLQNLTARLVVWYYVASRSNQPTAEYQRNRVKEQKKLTGLIDNNIKIKISGEYILCQQAYLVKDSLDAELQHGIASVQ